MHIFRPQVNTDEEGGEEEMEWLMEELEAPLTSSSSSQRGRSHHSNGHITTKPVNTDGLRSFSLDEDSEDEVLSVPGVRVVKSSGASRHSAAHRSAFLQVSVTFAITPAADKLREKIAHNVVVFFPSLPQEESDEDLVGLLEESDRKRKNGKPQSSGLNLGKNTVADGKRDEDDSDEDLLRV